MSYKSQIVNRKSQIVNRKSPALRPKGGPGKIVWFAAVAVLLIAFFFRFYRLADHPLGIFFDPAINGLDTARLMQRGGPVIFFPTNGGREAFFMYLLIPYIWLFGPIPFSLRAPTATISLLNVALLFAFLYQAPTLNSRPSSSSHSAIIRHSPFLIPHSSLKFWLATLGSLALAASYWHFAISRLGQRPILVPLLATVIFWFFLKGWAGGRRRWFILSGFFMGLVGHTYPAYRLLPLILVLALLPEFWPNLRPQSSGLNYKQVGLNLLFFIFAALLVYAPMAWYLVSHPSQFTVRAFSVLVWNFLDTPAEIAAELGRNIGRVAGFFCCAGSPNPIFGYPSYPGSSLLLLPFLLTGLWASLKNWRNFFHRLVLVWWSIGLIPSIIAIEAPHPLRLIVAVVPTAILIALGLIHVFTWLQTLIPQSPNTYYLQGASGSTLRITHYALLITFYVLPLLLILLPTPYHFRAYFRDWTRLQVTQGIYDYGAIAIREAILRQANQDIPIYLPLSRFNDSPLLYYLGGYFQRQAKLSLPPAEKAIIISPDKNINDATWVRLHRQTATILPPLTIEGQKLVQTALTDPSTLSIQTVTGETVARQALLADDPARFVESITHPLDASFGIIRLTGATYPKIIDPAASLPVTLFWRIDGQTSNEYVVLVYLVDDSRRAWGDGDARPTDWVYPTSFWRPSLDDIAAQHWVTLAPDRPPPGRYWLAVSIFDAALGQRLPLTAGSTGSPDTFFIGPLKVPLSASEPAITQIFSGQTADFGEAIQLAGFRVDYQTIAAGEPLQVSLLWQTLKTPLLDYTVFVHLLDAGDRLVTGSDSQPVAGRYPTTIWSPGEQILDSHTLSTPADLPPGQYRLAIGLYYQPSGERLPLRLANGSQEPQGRFILEPPITIENTLDHK